MTNHTDVVPEPTTPKTPVVHTAQTPLKPDRQVELAWRNMTYRVEVDNPLHADDPANEPKKVMRTLLHNMSGTARGSRVMAIMGPSGAGKTTLMSSFMGRLDAQKPNVLRMGPATALTGPIARGDMATVARQQSALDAWDGATGELYRALARATIDLAGR